MSTSEPKPKVPILMYHRIGGRVPHSIVPDHYVSAARFAGHLRVLKRVGYSTVSLCEMREQLFHGSLNPNRSIVISFDDGYESFWSEGMQVLQASGMKATVFLVADCVGSTNRWDEAKGDVSEKLMSRDQILEASSLGTEFGAHTLTHPDLRFVDTKTARFEIAESRRRLREMLGLPIRWFSYPYGGQGKRERSLVKEAGFDGACATGKAFNHPGTDPFALARFNVRATTSATYLLYKLFKARSFDWAS